MTEIARRPCAAHGCCREGTMIARLPRSTSDEEPYLCGLHFGARAEDWSQITTKALALDWLSSLIDGLRHFLNTGDWTQAAQSAYDQIEVKGRKDLLMRPSMPPVGDNPGRPPETYSQWLKRLENELLASTRPAVPEQQNINV